MIKRLVANRIVQLLKEFPAVVLLGPRQCGKTTVARQLKAPAGRKSIYLDLERPADLRRLDDMELFFENHREHFVIIDEVQNKPELFAYLRHEIDQKRSPGRFLLTGSASPELVKGVSESLAGRIFYLEMTPLSLTEVSNRSSMKKHWLRGGFPASFSARSNAAAMRWRESYIRSYAEHDLSRLFGVTLSAPLVKNFWSMLGGSHSGVFNAHEYARALGISAPTVVRYLDLLEGAYLVRRLPAWFVNARKRLVKSPKIYIRDSGLLHYFNQVTSAEDLPGNLIAGASWEGYVVEEIWRRLPQGTEAFFYRTHQGAEADLVIVRGLKPVAVVEIKFSTAPALTRGFYEALKDLKHPPAFVVIPEGAAYKDKHTVKVLSLLDFITRDLPRL